jgi:hypothetical protein
MDDFFHRQLASAVFADEATIDKSLSFGRHEENGARIVQKEAGTLRATFEPGRPYALVRLKPVEGAWKLDGAAAVLVDTHSFQYCDQPVTGRFDGEKCHAGFVDICNTHYADAVAASRRQPRSRGKPV